MRPRVHWLFGALLIAVPAAAGAQLAPDQMRAHFIDVGQGDATLLEFTCGVILVDAGAQNAASTGALLAYLDRFFTGRPDLARTLNAVFITHNHIDHTRALAQVADTVTVERLIETGYYGGPRDRGDVAVKKVKDQAAPGGLIHVDVDDVDVVQTDVGLTGPDIDPLACQGTDPEIRILSADLEDNPGWPVKEFRDKNNHSLVIRVDFGAASFLFTGDLEEPAIETLLDYYQGTSLLDTDVYQAGHHGSANGTTTALMKAIKRPRLAVISMGPCTDREMWTAWKYGHPRQQAVDQIVREVAESRPEKTVWVASAVETFLPITMKKAVYGTGWDGDVVVLATASGGYTVSVTRPGATPACGAP